MWGQSSLRLHGLAWKLTGNAPWSLHDWRAVLMAWKGDRGRSVRTLNVLNVEGFYLCVHVHRLRAYDVIYLIVILALFME